MELTDAAFIYVAPRPLAIAEKAAKLLDGDARARLARLAARLNAIEEWRTEGLESALRNFAESEDLKLGKVAQPLRAALTGATTSPGIFEVMAVLGRDEVLGRLGDI